jgi:predicted glycoside hydrolase/deacetylase ChbG (UPF0249 family)
MIFHADDLGASAAITEAVLKCVTVGAIHSASVMVNRQAIGDLEERLIHHPNLSLTLHLNLSDGIPIATRSGYLCCSEGAFRHTFPSLALMYMRSNRSRREEIREQILLELRAQCALFTELLVKLGRPPDLRLDSHEHFHFLPFVFQAIEALETEFPVVGLRLPRKVQFVSHYPPRQYLGLVKGALLTVLGGYLRTKRTKSLTSPDFLMTGQIDPFRLSTEQREGEGLALFHVGQWCESETSTWVGPVRHLAAYRAEHRHLEYLKLLELEGWQVGTA